MAQVVLGPDRQGSSLLVTEAHELVTTSGGGSAALAALVASGMTAAEASAALAREDRLLRYSTLDVDENTEGITYVLKGGWLPTDEWYIVRVVEFSTETLVDQTTLRYAGKKNNPSITTAAGAWANRASLVYGFKDTA